MRIELIDHGDPSVDEAWREMLGEPTPRFNFGGPLATAVDAFYVPDGFIEQKPESLLICEAILDVDFPLPRPGV